VERSEYSRYEQKSLKAAVGKSKDFDMLAERVVSFANAQGGELVIGIEDGEDAPPPDQVIDETSAGDVLKALRAHTDCVGFGESVIETHGNGGQYLRLRILPSLKVIAATSKGKIYIRVGDQSVPVTGEEATRLAAEKNAFQWELVPVKSSRVDQVSPIRIGQYCAAIRKSGRVSDHVKSFDDIEILRHYALVDGESLTNLGVLWLGDEQSRKRISYPLTVQYIVYDENERKVRKLAWHDLALNPKELIIDIERSAQELKYFYELPQGLFRKRIEHYAPALIREYLVNAIAHKSYTISGDVFIEVYTDRVEITNPGRLPLGITKDNILHQRQRRNPHLINVMHDLGLMEAEGSGYDLIYETLAKEAKPFPEIISEYDYVRIVQQSRILSDEILSVLDYALQHFELRQRDTIALGIIARERMIGAPALSKALQLTDQERLRSYVQRLQEFGIVESRGSKKGTEYYLSPAFLSQAKLNVKPTLKTLEPHRLDALILEDLRTYPASLIADISRRVPDIELKTLRSHIYKLQRTGVLEGSGPKSARSYSVAKKKRNEKEMKRKSNEMHGK